MKQTEKNSSKNTNNTNNNEVLSPEVIKAQLKSACANMTAKETKDYIKGLDGYELRLTGQKPTQHYTVFYGEVRICNVEQVQGIKADGSSSGCSSVPHVKSLCEAVAKAHEAIYKKIGEELTSEEAEAASAKIAKAVLLLKDADAVFDAANNRIAEAAKAAKKEAAKVAKVAKMTESMTLEQMMKQAELLAAAIEKAKAVK